MKEPRYEILGRDITIVFDSVKKNLNVEHELLNEPLNESLNEHLKSFDKSNKKTLYIGNFDKYEDNKNLKNGPLNGLLNGPLKLMLITMIKNNNRVTYTELSKILKVSRNTIRREIKKSIDNGEITRVGSKKNGYWKVNLTEIDGKEKNERYEGLKVVHEGINEGINDIDGGLKAVHEGINDSIGIDIIALIKENDKITYKEIAKKLNVSESKVYREIKKLIDNGEITRVGSKKTGNWKVK